MPVSSIAGLARGGAASVGGSRATAAKNVSLVSAAASGAPASVATGRAVRRSIAGRCRKAACWDRRKEESVQRASQKAAGKAAKPRRKSILRHSREGGKQRSRGGSSVGASRKSPSGAKQRYLDLYTKEFPITLKVLRAYPSKKEDFKPHDRSGSAIKLVHTFIAQNAVVTDAIRGEWKMPPNLPPAPATVTEGVTSYEREAKALIEAVRAAPESRLAERVDFFIGPGQMGKIAVRDLLWMMLMDSVHHRGQLSV